jgi:hypothetical protein
MDRSTNIDLREESLEFEMKRVIGVSRMITDTWHAGKPLQGLDGEVGPGKVIFTKFYVKTPDMDFGKEAFIMYWFSSESTISINWCYCLHLTALA